MRHASRQRLHVRILAVCRLGLATTAALPCKAAGLQWPPITDPPSSRHVPGKWVWAELFTEDVSAAMRFYGAAFSWSFQAFPAPRGPGYTLALADGEPVAGMLQREHEYQRQRGSRWLGMISVPDVDAATGKRAAIGALADLGKIIAAAAGTTVSSKESGIVYAA